MNKTLYFDNNATSALSPTVLCEMMPFLQDRYQNVSSIPGELSGLRHALRKARCNIASLLQLDEPGECVFTSGATESNNWAVEGVVRQYYYEGGHVITSSLEHPSLLEAARRVANYPNWSLTVIDPNVHGQVAVESYIEALQPNTRFVSLVLANSETGIIQPVSQIARAVNSRAPHAIFHSDITQAVGRIPVSFSADFDAVDLASFSAHKFHGPKGCGGLIIREGVNIEPLLVGGGQEQGRRSGTANLPAIVGCGAAALELANSDKSLTTTCDLRDFFESSLKTFFPDVVIFGANQERLPNTSLFAIPGSNGNAIAEKLALMDIWVGTGSACSSGALHPPSSLLAMRVPYSLATSAVRVSFSRYTEKAEVQQLISALGNGLKNENTA